MNTRAPSPNRSLSFLIYPKHHAALDYVYFLFFPTPHYLEIPPFETTTERIPGEQRACKPHAL